MTTGPSRDKTKTKPIKHTKKFKKMFGELYNSPKVQRLKVQQTLVTTIINTRQQH